MPLSRIQDTVPDASPVVVDANLAIGLGAVVVDTSALVAVIRRETEAAAVLGVLSNADQVFLSAGTLVECLVVAAHRGFGPSMHALLAELAAEIVPVDAVFAHAAGESYAVWGKGVHPAALNFGDCFAHVPARSRDLPLLYVGDDFARTDIRSALPLMPA